MEDAEKRMLCFVIFLFISAVSSSDFRLSPNRRQRNKAGQHLPGCYLGEKHYDFGDRWSPFMEPMGVMVCVKCECMKVEQKGIVQTAGEVICKNIKHRCPDAECDKPRTLPGHCCKICGPEDDIESNLTFRHERMTQPKTHRALALDDSDVYHKSKAFQAVLTGGGDEMESWSTIKTSAVAFLRITASSADQLDFTVRFTQLNRPKYLQIIDSHGNVQLETPLVKSVDGKKEMCGSWTHIPPIYLTYLRQSQLFARITSSKHKSGHIQGKISPVVRQDRELFTSVLSPRRADGTGASADIDFRSKMSTATITVTTANLRRFEGHNKKKSARIYVLFKGRTLYRSPRLALSRDHQLFSKWHIRSTRYKRFMLRGKLSMGITVGGRKRRTYLEGQIRNGFSCKLFQAIAVGDQQMHLVGHARSMMSLQFKVSAKGHITYQAQFFGPLSSKSANVYLEGARPNHRKHLMFSFDPSRTNKGQSADSWVRGVYKGLGLSSLHRLLRNRLQVSIITRDGSHVRGAIVSTAITTSLSAFEVPEWRTMPPTVVGRNSLDQVSAQLWSSVDGTCSLRLRALSTNLLGSRKARVKFLLWRVSDEGEKAEKLWVKPTTIRAFRRYVYVEGQFNELSQGMMLALDRGYAYIQLFIDSNKKSSRSAVIQLRAPNSCWRSSGDTNLSPIPSLSAGTFDDEEIFLEEQRDLTATLPGIEGSWDTIDINSDATQLLKSVPSCNFEGQLYPEGSAWLPDIEAECTTCSCVKGKTMCQRMICPKLSCQNPVRVPGECCPSCPEEDGSVTCRLGHDPREYRLHSTWHPYLPMEGFTRCAICKCTVGGEAVCDKVVCPVLSCDRSLWVKGDDDSCCYTCGAPQITTPLPELPQRDIDMSGACMVQNELRLDGESWHPVIQPFGFMKCFICHCTDGVYKCERMVCPSLKCKRRKKIKNVCCEVCAVLSICNRWMYICVGVTIWSEIVGGFLMSAIFLAHDETKLTLHPAKLQLGKSNEKTTYIKRGSPIHRDKETKLTLHPTKFQLGKSNEKTTNLKRGSPIQRGCEVDKQTYTHGEKWRPAKADKCAVCRCKDGFVKCRMRCPKVCSQDMKKSRCCQHCKTKENTIMDREKAAKTKHYSNIPTLIASKTKLLRALQ